MIDLRTLARTGAALAFDLAGQATETVVLHLGKSTGTYDPDTDTLTPTGGADITVPALAYDRKQTQLAPNPVAPTTGTTRTWMILAADIAQGVDIQEADTGTDANGDVWEILAAQLDPAGATWILTVHRR